MILKPSIEHLKNQNRSHMHFCSKTSVTCSTGNVSDPIGTGWLRRTSMALINLSPLRPLRGAILEAKVVVEIAVEDAPGNVARALRVTRYATSSGMGSVTKERTAHSSMSRIPSRGLEPQRTVKVGERRAVRHPKVGSQRRKWQRSLAHTFNREIAGGGTSVSTSMKRLLPPQRSPKGPIALHQRRNRQQKLRPVSMKGMLALPKERVCQRLQRP